MRDRTVHCEIIMTATKPHTELHDILKRGRFSPVTRKKYEAVLDLWIDFAGASPKGWTRIKAQAFYDDLCTRMQVNSANVYIASLRYVSKWYATFHDKPGLDFARIQTAEPTDSEKRGGVRHALTPDQATRLIRTCEPLTPLDRRDLALIVMGLETGMRRKSLGGAMLEKIHSDVNGYPTALVPIKGRRGDATFEVPLSDVTLQAIEPWCEWLRQHKVTKGPVFRRLLPGISQKGKRVYDVSPSGISDAMIAKIVADRARHAEIGHVHPHLLRHTFVTWREQAQLSDRQIASITGHKGSVEGFSGITAYIDVAVIGGTVRNSTPEWLRTLIEDIT